MAVIIICKMLIVSSVDKDIEKLEPSCTPVEISNGAATLKASFVNFQKFNNRPRHVAVVIIFD